MATENQETEASPSVNAEHVCNLSSHEQIYLVGLLRALEAAPAPWIADRIEVLLKIEINEPSDTVGAIPPRHFAPRVEVPMDIPQADPSVCPECGGHKTLGALLCKECDVKRQRLIDKGEEPKRVWKCKQCKEIPVLTKGRLCPACSQANLQASTKLCSCGTRISVAATQCARCQALAVEEPLEFEPEDDTPIIIPSFVIKPSPVTRPDSEGESGEAFGKPYIGMRAPTEGPSPYRGPTIPSGGVTGRRCPQCAGILFVDTEDKDYEYCLCGYRHLTVVPVAVKAVGQRVRGPKHAHQRL